MVLVLNSIHATVRTVSNSPLGGAQYGSLIAAFNASTNGDTLLLEPTDIPYVNIFGNPWNKKLILIGIGFNPERQVYKRTKIDTYSGGTGFYLATGCNGCRFYGIQFLTQVAVANGVGAINDIVFEDCLFESQVGFGINNSSTSYIFRNCIFNSNNLTNIIISSTTGYYNIIASNCVFDGYIDASSVSLIDFTIEHCIFLSTTVAPFLNVYNAQVENCIFMNSFPDNTFNSNYENNLSRVAGSFPPDPGNGNTASSNIEDTDPDFVDCPASTLFSYFLDFHLNAGSPAEDAGNDGTDIGIHGGFTGFSEQGEVLINPIVRSMNVINSSVQPNGTLMVHVLITKPDND